MTCRPEYDMKVVGQNLKRLRLAKKLSVDEVREYLCLGSVQAIYKYEKGKSYPQADTLFALMELYEASLYDIIRDSHWNNVGYAGVEAHPAASINVRYNAREEDEQSSSACFMGDDAAA